MNEFEEKLRLQQQMAMVENNAKQFLDREALLRYGNIKSVDPETALKAAMVINHIANDKKLKGKFTDAQFKELLRNLQEPKKEFRFTRK